METIGVVMATFNGEKFLCEQLQSIVSQTRMPDRVIVVDDGSRDETGSILRKYETAYPDLFHILENTENLGSKRSFEKGIVACGTTYIALSDQDDIWEPDKIETCVKVLKAEPTSLLCFHDLKLIDSEGNSIGRNFWEAAPDHEPLPVTGADARSRILGLSNPVPGCSVFFSSRLLDSVIPFPSSRWIGHDWWLSAVAFFLDDPICIHRQLTRYRFHSGQQAGIGTSLGKRMRGMEISIPFGDRILRETRRILKWKADRGKKKADRRERELEMARALLQLIEMCTEKNLETSRREEYEFYLLRIKRLIENRR